MEVVRDFSILYNSTTEQLVLNDAMIAINQLQMGVSAYRIIKHQLMIKRSTTYHLIRCTVLIKK